MPTAHPCNDFALCQGPSSSWRGGVAPSTPVIENMTTCAVTTVAGVNPGFVIVTDMLPWASK